MMKVWKINEGDGGRRNGGHDVPVVDGEEEWAHEMRLRSAICEFRAGGAGGGELCRRGGNLTHKGR